MKKFLKVLAIVIGVIIVAAGAILIGIYTSLIPIKFGKYDDNIKWKYYVNKTLKIEGKGTVAFINDDGESYFPEDIENIIISNGITGIKSDFKIKDNTKLKEQSIDSNNKYYSSSIVSSQDSVAKERNKIESFESKYENIETIHLPDSIKEIGDFAFICFPKLNNISIPKNIEKIDKYAFFNCNDLQTIDISETKIEDLDFLANIVNLKELNIANAKIDLNKIPSQIEKLNISNNTISNLKFITNLTNLKEVNMSGCKIEKVDYGNEMPKSLEKVDLSDAMIEQYEYLKFVDCTKLIDIKLPTNYTQINMAMFDGCKSLEKVELSENIKEIKSYAFNDCVKLKEIIFPDSLEKIGECSFENCISLTEIEIPARTFSIGRNAFKGCKLLSKVISNNKNINIDETAFDNCDNFKKVIYSQSKAEKLIDVVSIGDYVLYNPGDKYIENLDNYQGVKISETIKAEEMNGTKKWQVLSKDTKTGKIELVASDGASQSIEFEGINGYNNSEKALNEICSIYANKESGAVSARSLNVNDVNKITNYNPNTEDVSYTYKTKYELNNETLDIIENTDIGEYNYHLNSDSREYSYNTDKMNLFLKPSKVCWLASRYLKLSNSVRQIGIREISSSDILATYLGSFFNPDSKFVEGKGYVPEESSQNKLYTRSNSFLPVVELKTDIQTSGRNADGEWVLVND